MNWISIGSRSTSFQNFIPIPSVCMSGKMAEQTFEDGLLVPLEVLKKSSGVALDLGLSTTKIVYRNKDFYTQGQPKDKSLHDSENGRVHLALFPAGSVDKVIDFIKGHCDLKQSKDQNVICVCGRGLSRPIKELLERELNCLVVHENGDEVIGEGWQHLLKTYTHDELFYSPSQEGITFGEQLFDMFTNVLQDGFENIQLEEGYQYRINEMSTGPMLLADLGATFRFYKINVQDGSGPVELMNETEFGGQFFQGICGFFANGKSFQDLLKMAEENDGATVEMLLSDYDKSAANNEDGEDNIYDRLATFDETVKSQFRLFVMDKMVAGNREDAKVGDAVQSLLHTVCENSSSHIYYTAVGAGSDKACIAGSLIHSPLVRKWITAYVIMRSKMVGRGAQFDFEFIRHGGHLGALGAFLRQTLRG